MDSRRFSYRVEQVHVLLLGTRYVGKSAFLSSLNQSFPDHYSERRRSDSGLCRESKFTFRVEVDDVSVDVTVLDVSGGEEYNHLLPGAIRLADAFIFLYNTYDGATLWLLDEYIEMVKVFKNVDQLDGLPCLFVGNQVHDRYEHNSIHFPRSLSRSFSTRRWSCSEIRESDVEECSAHQAKQVPTNTAGKYASSHGARFVMLDVLKDGPKKGRTIVGQVVENYIKRSIVTQKEMGRRRFYRTCIVKRLFSTA
jgi:GTPase SAR1 family protein